MNTKNKLILVINPGSTSTKLAIYKDASEEVRTVIEHDEESRIINPEDLITELPKRVVLIREFLEEHKIKIENLDAIVSRSGELKPMPSGAYEINEYMIEDMLKCRYGLHPCNMGAAIAAELISDSGVLGLVVDPPTSDEFIPIAKLSGLPNIRRRSCFHVLNQRSIGKRLAQDLGKTYKDMNLIGIHMGGGISIAAHKEGRFIDANNALDGDGPYSPQRVGTIPAADFVQEYFKEEYDQNTIYGMLTTGGGLMGYLGTQDALEVEERILNDDKYAEMIYEGMVYQIAKEVGAMATVLKGKIDGIFVTGGLAHSMMLTNWLNERIGFLAPIYIYPGEDELKALSETTIAVLKNEQSLLTYVSETSKTNSGKEVSYD